MKIQKILATVLMLAVMTAQTAFAEAHISASAKVIGRNSIETNSDSVKSVALSVPSGQFMTGVAAQVVRMVNEDRAKYGLEPLAVDAQLTAAARVRAMEIVRKFSHTRPDGTKWSTVSGAAKGENIARGHSSAERVMAAWMTSDGHRKNILRESFGSIGVCALQVGGVIYWVQLFGR